MQANYLQKQKNNMKDDSTLDMSLKKTDVNFTEQDEVLKPEYEGLKPFIVFIDRGGCSTCIQAKVILEHANVPHVCYSVENNQRVVRSKQETLRQTALDYFSIAPGEIDKYGFGYKNTSEIELNSEKFIKAKQHGDPFSRKNAQRPYLYDPNKNEYVIGTMRIELHIDVHYAKNAQMNLNLKKQLKNPIR